MSFSGAGSYLTWDELGGVWGFFLVYLWAFQQYFWSKNEQYDVMF